MLCSLQAQDTLSLKFDETFITVGQVTKGEQITITYVYQNESEEPIRITDVITTCGCTVPDYPQEPILPDETGELTVHFDTTKKSGFVRKSVKVLLSSEENVQLSFLVNVVEGQ